MLIRQATHIDISGILELQVANLFSNLSPLERKKGFVTTPFTRELIEKIILQKGLFIALDKEKVIAYVFAGSWEYFSCWDIFQRTIFLNI